MLPRGILILPSILAGKKIGEGVRLSSSSAQLEEIPISDGQFFLKMMIAKTLVAVSDNSTVWRFFENQKYRILKFGPGLS
jgi:hypothetical protein